MRPLFVMSKFSSKLALREKQIDFLSENFLTYSIEDDQHQLNFNAGYNECLFNLISGVYSEIIDVTESDSDSRKSFALGFNKCLEQHG